MKKKILFITNLFFITFICSNCRNVHHGYKFEEGNKETVETMVKENKPIQEIINNFGSPTFINSPINDLLCYVSVDGKDVPFNRFYKPQYDFMCIKTENNKAVKLIKKTFDEVKEEKMIKYDNNIEELLGNNTKNK